MKISREPPDLTKSSKDLNKHRELSCTFRDSVLYLSALSDDVLVMEAFLLLNEVVVEAVLVTVGPSRRRVALWRDLHARYNEPLDKREHDPDDGGDGDHNLRREGRKQNRHPRRNPNFAGDRTPENSELRNRETLRAVELRRVSKIRRWRAFREGSGGFYIRRNVKDQKFEEHMGIDNIMSRLRGIM